MIDRFNFYDVYGYFIPGVALIMLALAPNAILGMSLPLVAPLGDFGSLVLGVIIAYISGHLLQSIARNALPSKFGRRYPSTWLLDPGDPTFPKTVKKKISEKAASLLGVELSVEHEADDGIALVRDHALLAARNTAADRPGSYNDQFEGLYTMMRGLTAAFILGLCYLVGWALRLWVGSSGHVAAGRTAGAALIAVFVLAFVRARQDLGSRRGFGVDRATFIVLAIMCLAIGLFIASGAATAPNTWLLWPVCFAYLAAIFRFYVGYKFFSIEFAKSVWRNFASDGS